MNLEYGATAQMGERTAAERQPLTHNSAVEFEVETDEREGGMTFTFGGKVATFVLLSGAVVSMVAMPSMFQGATFGLDDSTMGTLMLPGTRHHVPTHTTRATPCWCAFTH